MPGNDTRDRDAGVFKPLLAVCGLLFILLALLGALLPLLPTTPFLLLAAWCFAKSSPRLHRWLHTNRLFGEYLRRYRSGKGLSLSVKVGSISLLWIALASSAFALRGRGPWPAVLLAVVGLAVTAHIAAIKTASPSE